MAKIISMNGFDSSKFMSIKDSIDFNKENKFSLTNVSHVYNIKNEVLIYQSHIFEDYQNIIDGYIITYGVYKSEFNKPEYTSKRLYDTPDFWWLLLWLNKMSSIFDFKKETISVLSAIGINMIHSILMMHIKQLENEKSNPRLIKDLTLKKIIM